MGQYKYRIITRSFILYQTKKDSIIQTTFINKFWRNFLRKHTILIVSIFSNYLKDTHKPQLAQIQHNKLIRCMKYDIKNSSKDSKPKKINLSILVMRNSYFICRNLSISSLFKLILKTKNLTRVLSSTSKPLNH